MNKKSTGIKLKHSIRTESNRFAWELNQNKVCDDGEWSQICKEDFRWNLKFWNELELRDYSQLEGEERAKGWFDRSASFWRASKWTKLSCSCFFLFVFIRETGVCMCGWEIEINNRYNQIHFAFFLYDWYLHHFLAATFFGFISTFFWALLAIHYSTPNICLFTGKW